MIRSFLPLLLLAAVFARSAEPQGTFTATANMTIPRAGHTATLLPNGKVLIAGGVRAAELYDPVTGTFAATGELTKARNRHTATLLANGKVLIAGGGDNTAELYDQLTGIFTATGAMGISRSGHTATLLNNGPVLVAGGSPSRAAELYDLATQSFTATGDMAASQPGHIAKLLPNGEVLFLPGNDGDASVLQIYDPRTGAFSSTPWSSGADDGNDVAASLDVLASGKVLVTLNYPTCTGLSVSALLFDPSSGISDSTGEMVAGVCRPTTATLSGGTVLVTGGWFSSLASTQVYDPGSGAFSPAGAMTTTRLDHAATLLNDGTVLVTGGQHSVGDR
jgi:WD40 repeat protein